MKDLVVNTTGRITKDASVVVEPRIRPRRSSPFKNKTLEEDENEDVAMFRKAKRAPVPPQYRCQAGTLKGEQCANRVWLKCTTANLCCKHDPTHPSYKHPELDEVRKTQTKKQTKNERRQNPNLQPVPEDARQLYQSSMRAQGTPVPITSDSEAESVVAKEPEFCEICGKWGGPSRQCNFCGDRPSGHHRRCCEHNPDN